MTVATTSTGNACSHTKANIPKPLRLRKCIQSAVRERRRAIQRTEPWNKSSKIIEHKLFTHSISGLCATTGMNVLCCARIHVRVCESKSSTASLFINSCFITPGLWLDYLFLEVRVVRWGNRFKCANNVFPKVKLETPDAYSNTVALVCDITTHTSTLVGFSVFWNHTFSIFRSFAIRCYFPLLTATTTSHFHWILNFEVTEWMNEWVRGWLLYFV